MKLRMLAMVSLLCLAVAACGTEDGEPAGAAGEPGDAATEQDEPDEPDEPEGAGEPTGEDAGEPGEDEGEDAGDAREDAEDAGAVVTLASTDLGDVLADGDGRTLYMFEPDEGGASTCYDDCATTWPPLLADDGVEATGGADAALLDTVERDDGTLQATYAGHPLYHFAGDGAPGDTEGQGVGDVWWVLAADGDPVTGEEARDTGGYGGGYGSDY